MRLLDDTMLERSPVVANRLMNRERRLTSYGRELGLDLRAILAAGARWLDLCCGTASALLEAAAEFGDRVEITGVDLVDFFAGPPSPPRLRLVTASVATWRPDTEFDLITSVHGLHYVGDKLGVLARAAGWLAADGLLVANLDTRSIKIKGGGRVDLGGFDYDARARRIRRRGRREIVFPYVYLGSDDRAGPNYTGQDAVDSYYADNRKHAH